MRTKPAALLWVLVGISLTALFACDRFQLPRMSYDSDQVPRVPLTVKFTFDESLRNATLEQSVCADALWQGQLGQAVIKAFLDAGRKQFAHAVLEPPEGSPKPATDSPPDLIVDTRLIKKSFVATTRTGSSDQFLARLDVELAATYQDALGRPLLETPLIYSDQVSLWTPLLGSGGTQCATGQLDRAVAKAAEFLADRMVRTVSRLGQPLPASGQTAAASPAPSRPAQPTGPPTFSFRATLLDENDNQILEGGEKVGVRIDATNQGAQPLASVSLVLTGTPALLDAFASVLASPIQIGPLQPGETKSVVFWGNMPAKVEAQRGELTVSVASGSEGAAAVSQMLVAAIRPGSATAHAPSVRAAAGEPINRYAVVVGLDRYRDPTPQARPFGGIDFDGVPELLIQAGGIPDSQVLVLRGEHATRLDIEDAVVKWLPERVTRDSIVLFYFAGQAVVDPSSGTVYLIPYDATPSSSARRWIALQDLQRAFADLPARLSLLLIEATTATASGTAGSKAKGSKAPNWQGELHASGRNKQNAHPVRVIQIVRSGDALKEPGKLLAWLRGGADSDHDGRITVGEMLRALNTAGKVFPTLPPTAPELALPLTYSK